ncbi:MAG: ABC transporter permease subunit [Desulfatibacillaceae bacterium]
MAQSKPTFAGELKQSTVAALWFMFLTFPLMVIRVDPIDKEVFWRWERLAIIGVGSFFLSILWRYLIRRKEMGKKAASEGREKKPLISRLREERRISVPFVGGVVVLAIVYPMISGMYEVNIMTSALIFLACGLGLNIVVGLAGLLDLGYVAFYAVGAYTYALLNMHFGINFWVALPIGALMGTLFGVMLGFPVLRLRGDYLAIVTLGFGEIIRMVLENWNDFSQGPSGIANIPGPGIVGVELGLQDTTVFIYYIMLVVTGITIIGVHRLQNSRVGRAWMALREDEIACQAMGIDKTRTKLTAFGLGATWAGMAGVVFAAQSHFINPASFTFWESVIILCIVVLGGMGSIVGVIVGALVIKLMPEYFREFSEYRMVLFGAALVLVMVFRPQGIITASRKRYEYKGAGEEPEYGLKKVDEGIVPPRQL